MVKRAGKGEITKEFEGGLLPGLTGGANGGVAAGTLTAERPVGQTVRQPDSLPAKRQDGDRKKVTLYLDPQQEELMDDLLTLLKKRGLPRDNSMLVRALLERARVALSDEAALDDLVVWCQRTLPKR